MGSRLTPYQNGAGVKNHPARPGSAPPDTELSRDSVAGCTILAGSLGAGENTVLKADRLHRAPPAPGGVLPCPPSSVTSERAPRPVTSSRMARSDPRHSMMRRFVGQAALPTRQATRRTSATSVV